MINYYLKQDIERHDVVCIMEFIATIRNEAVLKETLNLMHGLCKGPTKVAFMNGISCKLTCIPSSFINWY